MDKIGKAWTRSAIHHEFGQLLRSGRLTHDDWSAFNLYVTRPRHELLWEAIDRWAPRREVIADVGCGAGLFLRLTRDLGFSRYIAVDWHHFEPERSFLEELTGVQKIRANFNTDQFLSDVEDDAADCVVTTEVLEHICHHPLGYLEECWRILREGGLLLLSTPNPSNLSNAVRTVRGTSPSWGDVDFAIYPKLDAATGAAITRWDIHYREYGAAALLDLLRRLPGSSVLEHGYLTSGRAPGQHPAKRAALAATWCLGLGMSRLLSQTQYAVVRKGTLVR